MRMENSMMSIATLEAGTIQELSRMSIFSLDMIRVCISQNNADFDKYNKVSILFWPEDTSGHPLQFCFVVGCGASYLTKHTSKGNLGNFKWKGQQQEWELQESVKIYDFSTGKNMQNNNGRQWEHVRHQQPHHLLIEQTKSEDGYNWKKYGIKKHNERRNETSYYKCTFRNCPTKKKVERSLDGHMGVIVYRDSHNHPKPLSTTLTTSSLPTQGGNSAISIL